MKKLILLLALAVFAVACEGPRGPAGPGSRVIIQQINVPSTAWQQGGDGTEIYYFRRQPLSDITNLILDQGTVLAYVIDGNLHDILPRVRHFGNGTELWTSTIDYTFGVDANGGFIEFFYTNSNFVYTGGEPGLQQFKVVITL